eukprot:922045_1
MKFNTGAQVLIVAATVALFAPAATARGTIRQRTIRAGQKLCEGKRRGDEFCVNTTDEGGKPLKWVLCTNDPDTAQVRRVPVGTFCREHPTERNRVVFNPSFS